MDEPTRAEETSAPPPRPSGGGAVLLAFLVMATLAAWAGWGWASGPARLLALLVSMATAASVLACLPHGGRLRRFGEPILLLLFVAALVWAGRDMARDVLPWARTPVETLPLAGMASFVVAFLAAVMARVLQDLPGMDGPGLPVWARAVSLVALVTGLGAFAARYGALWAEEAVSVVLGFLLVLLALEFVLVRALSFFRPSSPERRGARPPLASHVLGLFFARLNPLDGFVEGLRLEFNVDLRETWLFAFLKRSVLPLLSAQALAFVALTCLVTVAPHEKGVVERWGIPQRDRLLGPGLHLKAPWPVERVVTVPVLRIQSLGLGVEGDLKLPYRLWAKKHWENEYRLLLGDGRELVTFNSQVQYRIRDPFDWLYRHRDPRGLLESEAYRAISEEMVSRSIAEVLTRDRRDFTDTVTRRLQTRLDEVRSGLEIVTVTLNEVHPPVDVAPAYQDVVSAQLEERTRVLEAEVYGTRALPAAEAEATRLENDARAARAEMLGKAQGEAARILSTLRGYRTAPELFRWRSRLEAIEGPLKKAKVTVVDHRLRHGKDYFLDLREKP